MYEVIKRFTDLQDGNHVYNVGDTYPHDGYTPSEDRIAELASDKNRQKTPLIAEILPEDVEPENNSCKRKKSE